MEWSKIEVITLYIIVLSRIYWKQIVTENNLARLYNFLYKLQRQDVEDW